MNKNINKNINKENEAIFEEIGLLNPGELRHKCVLCEKSTAVDSSVSDNGSLLICIKCFRKEFDGKFLHYRTWSDSMI